MHTLRLGPVATCEQFVHRLLPKSIQLADGSEQAAGKRRSIQSAQRKWRPTQSAELLAQARIIQAVRDCRCKGHVSPHHDFLAFSNERGTQRLARRTAQRHVETHSPRLWNGDSRKSQPRSLEQ